MVPMVTRYLHPVPWSFNFRFYQPRHLSFFILAFAHYFIQIRGSETKDANSINNSSNNNTVQNDGSK